MKPLFALLALAIATPGAAQTMPMPSGAAESPADQAYTRAMQTMQRNMPMTPTGDADRDFVAGMIPHHQGAIDMAKFELQYGQDPAMRRLATNILAAQQREIAEMRSWQAKHGEH